MNKKFTARKEEKPYKKSLSALPVAEDMQLAHKMFGGSIYDMILAAGVRANEIDQGIGEPPMVPAGHKPTVTAVLEIQAGKLTKDYFRFS